VKRPPDGIIAPPGHTRPATSHLASSKQQTVHIRTELVFALFDLLGLRFIPRLRDATTLRLYLLGGPTGLPVDAVLRSRAGPQLICEQYDVMLRTAASLKRDWVPASLLITRLKNATPNPARSALGEYGRIAPTTSSSATAPIPPSERGSPAN